MLLKDIIKEGIQTISALYPEGEAREMVLAFLQDEFAVQRHTHIVSPDFSLSDVQAHKAQEAFERMAAGEPLQYLTGKSFFYGREFKVSPAVLIPRPETEILCRTALEALRRAKAEQPKVLDLCTGSGCIAWTIAAECPQAEVVAVDISQDALEVAKSQLSEDTENRPKFHLSDVLATPQSEMFENNSFDLLLSNPPYVMDSEKKQMRINVLEHEPHLALFVPDEEPLIFYRSIARWAQRLLKIGGEAIVEINEALGEETAEVFRMSGFADVLVIKDQSDKDRFISFKRIR